MWTSARKISVLNSTFIGYANGVLSNGMCSCEVLLCLSLTLNITVNTSGSQYFSLAESQVLNALCSVLRRVYGSENVTANHYTDVLNSLVFAGTIVGMLTFGYLSDRLGRKFGMVCTVLCVGTVSESRYTSDTPISVYGVSTPRL